jgi:hypothetical protein
METQSLTQSQTAQRLRRVRARDELSEFMIDLVGTASTYNPNFDVIVDGGGYTLVHRNARWLARLNADGGIEVLAGNDTIRATDEIQYNGRRVDRICTFGWKCFDADELRLAVFIHVAAWYWYYREWELRRLACMLHFKQSQPSRGDDRGGEYVYVYGDMNRFLNEVMRMYGTFKYHKVSSSGDVYVITSYKGWQAKLYSNGDIEIVIGRRIRIADQEIQLGDTAAEEICVCVEQLCFNAHDIRVMMFTYVALHHWNTDDVIRRLAQMVRPCR